MEKYIKSEIQKYRQVKKLLTIIEDADNPLSKKLRSEISIDVIEAMHAYVTMREDEGMQLLAYPKN